MNLWPLEGSARDRIHQAISGGKETLTAGVDDTNSVASSVGRSAEVSTRGSSISGFGSGSSIIIGSDSGLVVASGSLTVGSL